MTAVPGPRFRDKLAAEQKRHRFVWVQDHQAWRARCECKGWEERVDSTVLADDVLHRWRLHAADALLPLIEARVEAAATQRAAEELMRFAADLDRVVQTSDWSVRIPMAGGLDNVAAELRRRAAALAQPAPEAET